MSALSCIDGRWGTKLQGDLSRWRSFGLEFSNNVFRPGCGVLRKIAGKALDLRPDFRPSNQPTYTGPLFIQDACGFRSWGTGHFANDMPVSVQTLDGAGALLKVGASSQGPQGLSHGLRLGQGASQEHADVIQDLLFRQYPKSERGAWTLLQIVAPRRKWGRIGHPSGAGCSPEDARLQYGPSDEQSHYRMACLM